LPKSALMFETASTFSTGSEWMKSHWSALVQSSRTERPSGAQTTLLKIPVL